MATFCFDNDISFRVVHALRELVHGHTIHALRDVFPVETKDTTWIPEVGRNGWIVISRDHNQRRREAEHAARIIKNWSKIEKWGVTASRGTLAKLSTSDEIEPL